MKKILLSFVLLLGGVLFANAQTLWESESSDGTLITWGAPTAQCDNVNLAAGDFIKVTVKSVDTTIDSYPQASLTTPVGDGWDWTDLKSMGMTAAGTYFYEITEDMLEKINSHKRIFFHGTAAYLLKVELVPNSRTYPILWESESSDGTLVTWGAPTAQCDNVNLAAGDFIKVTVKSVDTTIDSYPQASLTTPVGDGWDWTDLKSMGMKAAGTYFYEITEDMLEKINSHKRIFFHGTAAYLSKVELLKLVPVTIGEYGWATFSNEYALDFSSVEDLSAYMITGHTGSAITKAAVTGTIPANTGLLLNGAAGTYSIPAIASSTTDVSSNLLKAGTGAAVSAESGKTKYVLSVTAGKAEFQKINTTAATVPTGKAYLEFNEAIEARSLDFDDEGTTAIKNMKVGENDNIYYDLQGRRVLYPKNGLYIVNGKKVILK